MIFITAWSQRFYIFTRDTTETFHRNNFKKFILNIIILILEIKQIPRKYFCQHKQNICPPNQRGLYAKIKEPPACHKK